jgi:small subunit ribosomal protein S8
MSMNDPLADMLTRIRNAVMVKFDSVDIPCSNLKKGVAEILRNEGYINDFSVIEQGRQAVLKIDLKYDEHHRGVITGLRRMSKPGRRMYVKYDKIPKVMSGLGVAILSTSKGIMTDRQARAQQVGGELLCHIW